MNDQPLKDAKAVASALSAWLDSQKVETADGTSAMSMLIGVSIGNNAENLPDLLTGFSHIHQLILVTAFMVMKSKNTLKP